ncbi:MAG: pyrroline-5-carboxylate reductase [Verrucomicrobiota bacterium]
MKVGILGTGKMGGALARGLVKGGIVGLNNLIGCNDREPGRLAFQALFQPEPVVTCADLGDWLPYLDVILLSIKPQQFKTALGALQGYRPETLFISVAAGISTTQIETLLGGAPRVVRAMPNTPCLVGEGVSAYCGGTYATESDLVMAEKFLASVGAVCRVNEDQINIVTALSGSGPAYAFHFVNGLVDGAVKLGLSPELARTLAVQTVRGSMGLMNQSLLSPLELAAQVKSPGGTTLAGCAILEQAGFEEILQKTVAAAKARADELASLS